MWNLTKIYIIFCLFIFDFNIWVFIYLFHSYANDNVNGTDYVVACPSQSDSRSIETLSGQNAARQTQLHVTGKSFLS